MTIVLRILQIGVGIVLAFLVYVVIALCHGTLRDWQPDDVLQVAPEQSATLETVEDSTLTFALWNVGYGGLGARSDFFYDNGYFFTSGDKMVRSEDAMVADYVDGMKQFVRRVESDFYLLQEVDRESKRSYYRDEFDALDDLRPSYASTFAANYRSPRVPLPVMEPWGVMGTMHSGLMTLLKYQPTEVVRYQLPGEYEWPTRIFQLDRCAALHRVPTASGKELVVVNVHNSAYDKGGFIKKEQMNFLRDLLTTEYAKGNYVVVGGDWNQVPPGVDFKLFMPEYGGAYEQIAIREDLMPEGWQWAYDTTVPTNRKAADAYTPGKTFVTLIDFFLVSPNVEVVSTRGVDQGFAYSDHQPVVMEVRLR